jgi:hypothetical protein
MRKRTFTKAPFTAHVKACITAISLLCAVFCKAIPLYAQSQCPAASSGVVTLALPSKHFPVSGVAEALSTSPHPSFAFVLRAFGTHYSNVPRLIDMLRAQPNHPGCITVIIYGDCGPCRTPRRPRGLFDILVPKENISSLNRKLEHADVRTLKAHDKEYSSILRYTPPLPGVRYIFMPALEDNYSDSAYRVVSALAHQVFALRDDIEVGRNRLTQKPRTFDGPKELHSYDASVLNHLSKGDILTGDGGNLCFPGDRSCKGYGLDAIRNLTLLARSNGIHFLLWRPDSSGLPIGIANNPVFTPVQRRTYRISGVRYHQQLLR